MKEKIIESEVIPIYDAFGRWDGGFTFDQKDIGEKRAELIKQGITPTKIRLKFPKCSRVMGMEVVE